jgi:DNA-binding LacI/PurR family transcriptional regulator
MAVACFDDTQWTPLVDPPLTALRRQDYRLGEVSAELILDQLTGRHIGPPRERLLPMELVVRRSCGC